MFMVQSGDNVRSGGKLRYKLEIFFFFFFFFGGAEVARQKKFIFDTKQSKATTNSFCSDWFFKAFPRYGFHHYLPTYLT